MKKESILLQNDILAYLKSHEEKDMLRFLTCGSVDDGKSTLIGRMLYDSNMIFEDQLEAIERDSKKSGTQGNEIDLALLVDGLQSEREQGITIDVAYRYFATEKRKFIIADTPGHEQYTRNMVTGASNSDLAIILIDAREGVKTQTCRHSYIVSLLGIKHVIVAINKMDLMDYSEDVFNTIKDEYLEFSEQLDLPEIHFIPVSALKGDNVVIPSDNFNWFQGATLLELLESIKIREIESIISFRFPVQYVNRPNSDFRGFSGNIAAGTIHVGNAITVLPSRKSATIKSIETFDGKFESAYAGQAVTLVLNEEIDVSRGDLICLQDDIAQMSNTLEAEVVWMSEQALMPNKQYDFKFSTQYIPGSIDEVIHRTDVNSIEKVNVVHLELNEIGLCRIKLTRAISFDNYKNNHQTGSFIIVDRFSNETVAAGMITQSLQLETADLKQQKNAAFEVELKALIDKHFPELQIKDVSKLIKF